MTSWAALNLHYLHCILQYKTVRTVRKNGRNSLVDELLRCQEHKIPRDRRSNEKGKFESNSGGSRPLLTGVGLQIMYNQDRLKILKRPEGGMGWKRGRKKTQTDIYLLYCIILPLSPRSLNGTLSFLRSWLSADPSAFVRVKRFLIQNIP